MSESKKDTKGRYCLQLEKYLTLKEVRQLRRTVKVAAEQARLRGSTRALVNEMLIEIMLESGLRHEEICHLRLQDLPTHHGKDEILVRNGMGQLLRTVLVKAGLRAKLQEFIKHCRPRAKRNSRLFVNGRGYRLAYTRLALYKKIKRIGRQADLPRLTPQILRNTFAVHLYAVAHDLRFIQEQLGHKNPVTTIRYALASDDERKLLRDD